MEATQTFTPDQKNGTIEVEATLDGKRHLGRTIGATVAIRSGDRTIATREVSGDPLRIPRISARAVDATTGTRVAAAGGNVEIADEVAYECLKPGTTYVLHGTVRDAETGALLMGEDRHSLDGAEATREFTPTEAGGTVTMTYRLDAAGLAGRSVAVTEELRRADGGPTLATYDGIANRNEVRFPSLSSFAVVAREGTTIRDVLSYANLIPGLEYVATGTLRVAHDGESDGAFVADEYGEPLTASDTFTPEDPDGTVELRFDLTAADLSGRDLVTSEQVTLGGHVVASQDDARPVSMPKVSVALADARTGLHEARAAEDARLTATVMYDNLPEGESRTATVTLVDAQTDDVLLAADGSVATSESALDADEGSGSADLTVMVDARALAGHAVTAKAYVRTGGEAIHAETDEAESIVRFPKLETMLCDAETGTHVTGEDGTATLCGTVSYAGLAPGAQHAFKVTITDAATGKPVDEGRSSTSVSFVPESSEGTVSVSVPFVVKGLSGKTVASAETLSCEDVVTAEHTGGRTDARLSIEYDGDDEVVRQYVRAIEYEFQALFDRAVNTGDNPTQAARKLIRYIDAMIDSIKFCVILTGNESDAYTLFEVLNDRAMEVDDLDLIKNLFLRQYCNTSHEGETLIDKTVGEIDTQWGEQVFKPGLSQARAKMISYLGAVFLTADSSIHSNKTERFREVIDTQYFGHQYVTKPYTSECIRRDITIYQMIGVLFDRYKLQAMKKDVDALKAEVSNFSITFRALHLLNALGQDGVMAALVNLILRTYIDNMEASQRNPLSMENFKEFLDDLKSRSSHQQDAFSTLHRWAFELWKATLLSESYEYPREIARKIISSVHSTANNIESVAITKQEHDAMVSSFNSWISACRYKKSPVMLKTKILFCELIFSARSEDEGKLIFSKISMSINTEKLQLDHLDAQNPTDEYADFYYIPDDPNAQRRDTIDGLGNMMILTSEENNNKGNKPLEDALSYYKVMCPNGHWLIEVIKLDLEYDGYYRTVNAGNKQRRVPTDQFFTMRKEQLRRYFLTILSRDDIDDTEAMICAS